MQTYQALHARSISDPEGFWREQAVADRLAPAVHPGARLRAAAVRPVVRRRPHQPVPQRGRPAPARAGRCPRPDLSLHRDRPGEDLHVPPAAPRGEPHGGDPAGTGRRQGRPRVDLHADDPRGDLRHARLRAHRRDPLGGVRRVRVGEPRHAHRRREAEAGHQRRCRLARRQAGALQAPARRGDPPVEGAAGAGAAGGPRPRRHGTHAGPRRGLCRAARGAHERRGAVRMARELGAELHPLHQRHDRQAEGRAARHRRLRGGARRVDAADLQRPQGRDLLRHQRHRLGGGPQLHRLRAADRRHGDDHVRGHADPPGRRHLVADRREVQGHDHVLRADGDPRAEEAGSRVPAQVRPLLAAAAVPRRRAAR